MNKTLEYAVPDHFAGKDSAVRAIYDRLMESLRKLGPVREEAKKTCIHLVRSSALAGVEVRKTGLVLNIKADHRIESSRIDKTEQISANRFHHRVKLSAPGEIDQELTGWLKHAYDLSG